MRTKIFVIGSVSQYDEIQTLTKRLSNDADVDYVKPKDEVFADLVHSAFQKISDCDVVMALKKPDGTLGEGVTYEVEFATWLKKPVIYVNSTGCKCISSEKSHLDKDESGPSDKKIFSYYQYDNLRCEKVIGIVIASNLKEAKKIVNAHYKNAYHKDFTAKGWEIEEIKLSDDGCCEIYYGG